MQLEIEAGAKLTVIETEKEGLTLCAVAAVLRCHARCGFLLYGQPADARERIPVPEPV